ncbi:hypothetical protein AA0616_1465 [Komagataeibacter nataicola NRIC 0616]|nr:hypothetical protein AA0616_1465 [Komagataeibacter nataicola NRIC 0616]
MQPRLAHAPHRALDGGGTRALNHQPHAGRIMVQHADDIDTPHVMTAKNGKRVRTAPMHKIINTIGKNIVGCIVPDPHAGAFTVL